MKLSQMVENKQLDNTIELVEETLDESEEILKEIPNEAEKAELEYLKSLSGI